MRNFLLVNIDEGGFIRVAHQRQKVVHKETRRLHHECITSPTLLDVLPMVVRKDDCVLELTEDGGGEAIWIRPDQEDLIKPRLQIWKGCYGAWPTRIYKGEAHAQRAADARGNGGVGERVDRKTPLVRTNVA